MKKPTQKDLDDLKNKNTEEECKNCWISNKYKRCDWEDYAGCTPLLWAELLALREQVKRQKKALEGQVSILNSTIADLEREKHSNYV
jgi:hypothetical protein